MSTSLKLHNAMWPGLVGKGDGEGEEPAISFERMLELTAQAEVKGQKFDGIDCFLFLPHSLAALKNPWLEEDHTPLLYHLLEPNHAQYGNL